MKQRNLLTGTEVWTVPGRGNRPLPSALPKSEPLSEGDEGVHCAFCEKRYLETPPEKTRSVRVGDKWERLTGLSAEELFDTTAEFRRVPNLFEIVSYNYWHLNHGHVPSEVQHRRMAEYLASDEGYDHVMSVIRTRLLLGGASEEEVDAMSDSEKLQEANGFFSGGHDLIIGRRHYANTWR